MVDARLHLIITGDVHDVNFRTFVLGYAKNLHLKGWARNITNGVEVIAEGPRAALVDLLDACKKGPSGAHVDNVLEAWNKPTGEFTDFDIRH